MFLNKIFIKKTEINKTEINRKEMNKMMFNRKSYSFENKKTVEHGALYSRYIASWLGMVLKTGLAEKKMYHIETIYGKDFVDWLTSIGLNEDEIHDIRELATNGKLEFEDSAYNYIVDNVK